MKLTKWNLSSYETCSCGRERQVFLTSFIWQVFIWQVLFACVEGQNCQFFPCQQVNWWIVRTSEQAETGNGGRKQIQQHQGQCSLQRSSRPSWPDCWPKFFVMAGAVQGRWSEYANTILLENLRPKESLWNLKVEAYGNKSKKKSDIEELLEEVADVAPQGVDTILSAQR